MQPEKLKNIAADLLAEIIQSPKPAEEILNTFTRTHKSIGSANRRFLNDVVYQVLRAFRRLSFLYPTADLREKTDLIEKPLPSLKNAPSAVQWEIPDWLLSHIEKPEQELPALMEKAEVILRANGSREEIRRKLAAEGIETEPTKLSPWGLILKKRANLKGTACYREGLIEVQDEGSQLVALKTGIQADNSVLDYCAGAGGKSLIFAQMMQNKGQITAHDISERSLQELNRRAERAGIRIIQTTTKLSPTATFDYVVVDAPCSGTGTWRRFPDRRLKLTFEQFEALLKKQKIILQKAASYVKENGKLVYITCSITRDENIGQIRLFLKKNKAFKLCTHQQLSPYRTQTDGFFYAVMQRTR